MSIKIRAATPADGPRICAIVLAAIASEQPWSSYVSTGVTQNPGYVSAVERLVKGYIEASDTDWVVRVAEAHRLDAAGRPIVASVAVWDMRAAPPPARRSSSIISNRSSKEENTNKGAPTWSDDWAIDPDNAKLVALNKAFSDGKLKYFSSNGPQVFLRLLATSPEHQRSGYAKALCRAGLEMSWQRHASVCVQTATKGYITLSGLGFSQIGVTDLPTIPGHDDPILKALKLDVGKGQEAHPSFMTSFWNYVRN